MIESLFQDIELHLKENVLVHQPFLRIVHNYPNAKNGTNLTIKFGQFNIESLGVISKALSKKIIASSYFPIEQSDFPLLFNAM